MIELDVRMSREGELIVLHDRTVNRTTNGRGTVWHMTVDELKRLDAGSWFSSRFAGERIPLLLEVVHILPMTMSLNIEVKTDGRPKSSPPFEERLVQFLHNSGLTARVLVSSFDYTFLKRLHSLDAGIRLGVLYVPIRDIGRKPSTLAQRVGASAFICSHSQLRKRFADDARTHKLQLACYGVNTRRQAEKALRFGVRALITDHPREMRTYVEQLVAEPA